MKNCRKKNSWKKIKNTISIWNLLKSLTKNGKHFTVLHLTSIDKIPYWMTHRLFYRIHLYYQMLYFHCCFCFASICSNKNSWSGHWTMQTMQTTPMNQHPSIRTQITIWNSRWKLYSTWNSRRQQPIHSHNKSARMWRWKRWRMHRSKVMVTNMEMVMAAWVCTIGRTTMTVAVFQIWTVNRSIHRLRRPKITGISTFCLLQRTSIYHCVKFNANLFVCLAVADYRRTLLTWSSVLPH